MSWTSRLSLRFALSAVILAAMSVCGCQGPAPMTVWQQRLTDFVSREGNGDPGILREAPGLRSTRSLRPAEVKFSATGIPGSGLFSATRDVQGVLVGLASERGRGHFVFLVGVNEQDSSGNWGVIDIRPISFEVRGNEMYWRVGPERDDLLARYLAAGGSAKGGTTRSNRRSGPFPRPDDVFRMETRNDEVFIEDPRSKVVWSLSLPGVRKSSR